MKAVIYEAVYREGNLPALPVSSLEDLLQLMAVSGIDVIQMAPPLTLGNQSPKYQVEKLLEVDPVIATANIWITHGLFPGSRDQIGVEVSDRLNIPYVLFEPSHRSDPPSSSEGIEATQQQIAKADLIVSTNSQVASALSAHARGDCRILELLPFLDAEPCCSQALRKKMHRNSIASLHALDSDVPWLLTWIPDLTDFAQSSVQMLAIAISRLLHLKWHLIIGTPSAETGTVLNQFVAIPKERIKVIPEQIAGSKYVLFSAVDLFVWPALHSSAIENLLFAQAAGVPVIATDSCFVRDRVINGQTGRLSLPGNVPSFAQSIEFCLRHQDFLSTYSENCQKHVLSQRDVRQVADAFRTELFQFTT